MEKGVKLKGKLKEKTERRNKMNLKKETIKAINESEHSKGSVVFVGSSESDYGMSYEEFEEIADFEYDSGYGCQKISEDLIVLFEDNTYLRRLEYDGSEWWELEGNINKNATIPFNRKGLQGGYYTIKETEERKVDE